MTFNLSGSFAGNAEKTERRCVVCGAGMVARAENYFICRACGYMASGLTQGYGAEVGGIAHLRTKNYVAICDALKARFFSLLSLPSRPTVLDVGCANGLFLQVARGKGFDVTGLEPDGGNASNVRARGFEVIGGFFPDAEQLAGRTFDIIIFNDSFEHIPDPARVIQGIRRCLKAGGLAVVNIPSSKGLIFTLSSLMSGLGITSPFDRLWQKGFASPHLHYFNPANLRALFEKHGFGEVYHAPLSYYTLDKLWERVRCNTPFLKACVAWCCLTAFYPVHITLKSRSDCFVSFFQLND